MTIRTLLFWIHLGCGVLAGAVILVMSATGVLLTYQRQITAWYDTRGYDAGPPAPGAARLPVDALVSAAAARAADGVPMTVTVRADPDAPASIAIGQRTLFVNAYTGAVLGEGAPGVRAFFRRVTAWHRWLGASDENRASARKVTGLSNLAFLVIVASGPLLWWPRTFSLRQIRNVVWFKRGLPSKARDFNWHNTIGIWSTIPLLVVVASGVVISYPWASNLVYRVAGEQPPVQGARARSRPATAPDEGDAALPVALDTVALDTVALDTLVARAAAERPAWRTIAIRVPIPPGGPATVTVDEGNGGQPQKRGTLTVDAATGALIRWEGQADLTPGRRARSWLRFAHTGEVYGLAGQTVAGLASLGGVVLVWTGLALALRRLLRWRVWRDAGRPEATRCAAPRPG